MTLHVLVAYARPGAEWLVAVQVLEGACIADALAQGGTLDPRLATLPADVRVAIFGVAATLRTALRDGDRIELTRPLKAEPKAARRARALRRQAPG